jgi:porphobilinogen synthase
MSDLQLVTGSDTTPLVARPRRLRRTEGLRRLLAETRLAPELLVHPMFVRTGRGIDRPIAALPGFAQRSPDRAAADAAEAVALSVRAFMLFGIPDTKDERGSSAWSENGPIPQTIGSLKDAHPDSVVIADVCLCEYTDHGHCGVLDATGGVDNDATLPLLARAAVAYADAGADLVAPSAMMDGQVRAIRGALDEAGHHDVGILSYAVKYASAFYGPFRQAAESSPASGDRRGYQMDAANAREALREAALDVAEGVDMLMVKPAGPYLDVIRAVRDRFNLPLAAYQVSGEFAMIKAAAERGLLDERRAAMESAIAIRRAGADVIISYFAKDLARWLSDGD